MGTRYGSNSIQHLPQSQQNATNYDVIPEGNHIIGYSMSEECPLEYQLLILFWETSFREVRQVVNACRGFKIFIKLAFADIQLQCWSVETVETISVNKWKEREYNCISEHGIAIIGNVGPITASLMECLLLASDFWLPAISHQTSLIVILEFIPEKDLTLNDHKWYICRKNNINNIKQLKHGHLIINNEFHIYKSLKNLSVIALRWTNSC